MKKILNSKITAWLGLIVVVAIIVSTFKIRTVWWAFFDEFFFFMAAFSQLAAVYLKKLNVMAGKKLKVCALVFLAIAVISLVAEYIAFQIAL